MKKASSVLQSLLDLSPHKIAKKLGEAFRRVPGFTRQKLSSEQVEKLRIFRATNLAASAPFRATDHWRQVASLFDREFHNRGLSEVEDSYYNLRFSGFAKSDPRLSGYLVWTYYQLIKERDVFNILERMSDEPREVVVSHEVRGRTLSLDTLISIDDFYNLVDAAPEIMQKPLIIADIGAGWGRLGRIIKTVAPQCIYMIFDLPEPLLISSYYLPRILKTVKFSDHLDASDPKAYPLGRSLLETSGLWFLGSQDLARIEDRAIDIVVNIASFQEMTKEQVASYLTIIDHKATGGHLYTRNLWKGSTHGHQSGEIGEFSDYQFPSHWKKLYLRDSRLSNDFFEAAFNL
jgi:putative sugar O-methyltransferase